LIRHILPKISPNPSFPSGPGAASEGLLPRREALWAGGQRGEFLPFVSDPERSLTRRVKGGRRDLVFSVYTIMD
jgi:hypothetical protein